MYISLTESRANGFRLWSETHQPHSNDRSWFDALTVAPSGGGYAAMPAPEQPRAPWLVPGVGNTF